jgi:carboxypeptidase Q
MSKICILLCLLIFTQIKASAQKIETETVTSLYREALTDRTAYDNLRQLCRNTSGRVTGSPQAARAVEFTFDLMKSMDLDSVYQQPVMVPRWERGKKEKAIIRSGKLGNTHLNIAALGLSVGTGKRGVSAQVVEVMNFNQLDSLGSEFIDGKIVFFNRPMDPVLFNTFASYGQAADQRMLGAASAAAYGAVGVIVRSLTTAQDDYPHTGVLRYAENSPKIPAVAVSTNSADLLSNRLKEDPGLVLQFRTSCQTFPDVVSANVIGEISGSVYPEEIITLGGHLDAWDLGEGAQDDGAGCIQAVEVLRLFKKLGIQPKRTVRAVMFMDEEIGQRGGKEYARQAEIRQEKHYFAIESDRGGLLPLEIGISTSPERFTKMAQLSPFFEPWGIYRIREGGGGSDITPLQKYGTPLASFIPDSQRYFDYHHSANDTFDKVNIRELQLGSAAMAALVYLIDQYDL